MHPRAQLQRPALAARSLRRWAVRSAEPAAPPGDISSSGAKLALLSAVAGLDRGKLATKAQAETVQRLVKALEQSGAGLEPFAGSPAPVDGRWELVYTNKEVFRASPFFAAFASGLIRDQQVAEAIFAFTDAVPGAEIGAAIQTISLLSGTLLSDVQLSIFPWQLLTGSVVTTSRLEVLNTTQLGLTVESTRVAGSRFPLLDAVAVPVEQLVERVRGQGATRVVYDITFVDDALRITRCGDQVLVHRRLL